MKTFEYKTFSVSLSDDNLNSLGAQGWELISHTAVVNNKFGAEYYIFKRQKPPRVKN